MLINITNNKTHNIHDSIYTASTYDFVNIVMVINMICLLIIQVTKRIEYFMDKNLF